MEKLYIIKSISPWMIEELLALSEVTRFSLVLVRYPNEFYDRDIKLLRKRGIKIYTRPLKKFPDLTRILFVLIFLFKNLKSFFQGYSAVIGFKSIWWFLKLEDSLFKARLIHSQFATQATLLAWMIKEYNQSAGTKYYFTFHAYDIYFNNLWFSKLVNNSEVAFSISEYNIEYIKNNYSGLEINKLKLSRLGTYTPQSCNRIENLNDNMDCLNLGFISWFVSKKGIFYLLEAMKVLKNMDKNVKLKIAGDGPLKNEMLKYIENNKLDTHINYIGKVNKVEKHNFFCSLDALVLPAITVPNDQDGIPVVLMEAVSYGLPLISTNISGIPEICINNYNGLLIPEKDINGIIKAIIKTADQTIRKTYSANSKKVFKHYNIYQNTRTKASNMGWLADI